MNRIFQLLKPSLQLMKWFGLAALFGCGSNKTVSQGSLASGPFEICWEVTESRSGSWFNNGGDFNAKVYTSWFQVKYQGQVVKVPAFDRYWGSVQAGTNPDKPIEYFWQALFLKDAPKPAVMVGIHSMHLLTEENGQLKIIPLHEKEGDFATYQWLDGENGQPGAVNAAFLGDDSKSSRFLAGGRYLMINSKVVFDVQTLQIYPFDLGTHGENQKDLDNYNATNHGVVQLSPSKSQIVLVGSRFNPENRLLSQYGLVAVDFKKNKGYAVPFDRTDTRFFSIWDANLEWQHTYFEWTTDKAGEDKLVLRKLKQLPYWKGLWDRDEQNSEWVRYRLRPVDTTMLPVFVDFIKKEVNVTAEKIERTPHHEVGSPDEPSCYLVSTMLETTDDTLYIYLNPIEQTISLQANKETVEKIGKQFDEALSKGKFQEFFGRYE